MYEIARTIRRQLTEEKREEPNMFIDNANDELMKWKETTGKKNQIDKCKLFFLM